MDRENGQASAGRGPRIEEKVLEKARGGCETVDRLRSPSSLFLLLCSSRGAACRLRARKDVGDIYSTGAAKGHGPLAIFLAFRHLRIQTLSLHNTIPLLSPFSSRYPLHSKCSPSGTLLAQPLALLPASPQRLRARRSPYFVKLLSSSRHGHNRHPNSHPHSTLRLRGKRSRVVSYIQWLHCIRVDGLSVNEELVAKLQSEIAMEEDMKEDEDLSANIKE